MSEPSTTDLIVLHAILPRDDDMVDLLVSLACHAVFVRAEGCHIWAAWTDDAYGNGFAEDWGDIVVARVRLLCGQLVVIMPSGWHHPIETIQAKWERIGE